MNVILVLISLSIYIFQFMLQSQRASLLGTLFISLLLHMVSLVVVVQELEIVQLLILFSLLSLISLFIYMTDLFKKNNYGIKIVVVLNLYFIVIILFYAIIV